MLERLGRNLILVTATMAAIIVGILIATIFLTMLGNAGNVEMSEYFSTYMSGTIGIVLGTCILWLYMKRSDRWNVCLNTKEEVYVKMMCVYSLVAVCICRFVFEVVSTFVLSRLMPNMAGYIPRGITEFDKTMNVMENLIVTVSSIVIAPVSEEILFRKCLYGSLKKEFGVAAAMILTSILFAVLHGYGVQGFLSCALAGFIFACLYEKTGNIWYSIAAHLLCNVVAYLSSYMEKIKVFGKPLRYEVNGYYTYHTGIFIIAIFIVLYCFIRFWVKGTMKK
ncbi:MAG: CPBP family intramembrane metalloprotease [Lachnospiraceae bacterium]|nr:CPBP family intramembrane metalloprotease [Lachnospiraceae bacterium]